jgi:hypothetical protein
LLRGFRLWLVDNDVRDRQEKLKKHNKNSLEYNRDNETARNYLWIENLLQTPIPCFRRYCLYKIIIPYLINVRGLSYKECFNISYGWLEKCNRLSKVYFNKETEINVRISSVKGYKPISIKKLKNENFELYHVLLSNKIMHISG